MSRTFELHKHGKLVEVEFSGSDRFRRQGTYEPLGIDRVVGVDTESLVSGGVTIIKEVPDEQDPTRMKRVRNYSGGRLDTVLLPMWFSTGPEVVETAGRSALEALLEAVCGRYSVPEPRASRTAQRVRGNDGGRDGRREGVDPVLLVFFNLPYDMGRLCSRTPQLLRALASGADTYTVWVGRYSVEVARMVLGNGSSFEWYVREEGDQYDVFDGNSRITRLLGLDMHGYWKSSLAASAKALGVSDKLDVEAMLRAVDPREGDDREWFRRAREEFSEEEWGVVRRYSAGDAQSTMELYAATVDLLRTVDARVVRRTGVIPPSAPGAAARIAFAKAHDGGVDSWRRPPAWVDQMGCDAYRGARAFCARPGRHEGVVVRDMKSAYPYAMAQLPDPVTLACERVKRREPSSGVNGLRDLRGLFGVLVVDGEGLDPVYPALRCHDEERGRLRGVYGPFRGLSATIPEVLVGVVDGSLRVDAIRDGVVMRGSPERSFLRRAVFDYFAIKDDPSNAPALRGTGKLLGVSLYGKLIETQCDQYWLDSDVMCPPFSDTQAVADALSVLYAETPAEEFDDRAAWLIERCASHAISCRDAACRGCDPEPVDPGPAAPVRTVLGEHRRYKAGQYFMPLYAAQVTGLTSASLGAMARATGAVQGDTDSAHTVGWAGEGVNRFHAAMAEAGYAWPDSGLGSWSVETPIPSEESWCARTKLYSHRFADGTFLRCPRCRAEPGFRCRGDGQCADRPYKQAMHGFSKYPGGAAALHNAVREVALGGSYRYTTRPSPRKIREALVRGLPVGEFVSREVQVAAGIDPNTEIRGGVCYWKRMEERCETPF